RQTHVLNRRRQELRLIGPAAGGTHEHGPKTFPLRPLGGSARDRPGARRPAGRWTDDAGGGALAGGQGGQGGQSGGFRQGAGGSQGGSGQGSGRGRSSGQCPDHGDRGRQGGGSEDRRGRAQGRPDGRRSLG